MLDDIANRIVKLTARAMTAEIGGGYSYVANGDALKSTESFQSKPNRHRAVVTTRRLADFIAYAEKARNNLSAFFIDPEQPSVTGIFDYLNEWGDHIAVLRLAKTPLYASLTEHRGTWTPKELREWLEDFGRDGSITPIRDAKPITLAAAIDALRGVKVKVGTEVVAVQNNLSATKSVLDNLSFEGAEKGKEIPESFEIAIPLYEDTTVQKITVALLLTSEGEGDKAKPVLLLRIIAHEALKKLLSDELEARVKALEGAAIYVGTVQLGQA